MTSISTIIPVWNRDVSLTRAINSALAQELPDGWSQEVIVVDDGSTLNIRNVLRSYEGSVTVVTHEKNGGAARARNTGVAAAKSEYIAFLDSDDIWLPGKLAAQISFMREKRVEASCSSYVLVRADNSEIISPRYQNEILSISDLAWGCFVSPGSTLVCARRLFKEVGDLDVSLRRLEDWDWLLRLSRSYPLGFLQCPLARIYASGGGRTEDVLAGLSQIEMRHVSHFSSVDRRNFNAAIALERAAAYGRSGRFASAALSILYSLWLAPIGHVALASVMHNRLARP
jgi:glycosyltransferase involved in cell wall biosynthesis